VGAGPIIRLLSNPRHNDLDADALLERGGVGDVVRDHLRGERERGRHAGDLLAKLRAWSRLERQRAGSSSGIPRAGPGSSDNEALALTAHRRVSFT
jgi:hypothetical protein